MAASTTAGLAEADNGSKKIFLRIGLQENTGNASIGCEGDYKAVDSESKIVSVLSGRNISNVHAVKNSIVIGNKIFSSSVELAPVKENDRLSINGKRYRGILRIISKNTGKITVINKIGIEEYLYGVLPMEVSYEWPVEALKAQAVVSRTYAIKSMGKYEDKGYDLSATFLSQVYGGMNCENSNTTKAVDQTKGEIITFKGQLISAVFHSTCGGFTENVGNVWDNNNTAPEYMEGVCCPYCRKSPQYNWECVIKKETIRENLEKKGYHIDKIDSIRVAGRAPFSKRAIAFNVYHSGGRVTIPSNEFRMAVGSGQIRSTLLNLKNYRDKIKFVGRGWGHGVGLCQWGAKGMADKGYGYMYIINKYFPRTKIVKR